MVMEAICEITGNIFQLSPGHFKNHSPQCFRHCLMAVGPTGERRSICRCKSQSMGHGATPRMGSNLILNQRRIGFLHGLEEKNFKNDCRFILIYLDLSSFQIFYVRMVAFPSLGEHHKSDNRHATCAALSRCRHWQQTLAVWVSLLYQIHNIYILLLLLLLLCLLLLLFWLLLLLFYHLCIIIIYVDIDIN